MMKYILSVIVVSASIAYAKPPTKNEIDAAKKDAVAYLLSVQQPDGCWEPPTNSNQPAYSVTLDVLSALVAAGEDPAINVKLQKPLEQIVKAEFRPIQIAKRMKFVSNPIFKGKYKNVATADMAALAKLVKPSGWVSWDAKSASSNPSTYDMYLAFNIWEGMYVEKAKIPEAVWMKFVTSLIKAQSRQPAPKQIPGYAPAWNDNGGWQNTNDSTYGEGGLVNHGHCHIAATSEAMLLLLKARDEVKAKATKTAIDASLKDGFDYLERRYVDTLHTYGWQRPEPLAILAKTTNHPVFANENVIDAEMEYVVKELRANMKRLPPQWTAARLLRLCN